MMMSPQNMSVTPAKAGVSCGESALHYGETPAFAGVTAAGTWVGAR